MKKLAVLFPGQGTQAWGMGKDLYESHSTAKAVFDEADKILGYSFSKKLFENDSTEIMETEVTQLAIFLTSVAYYKVFVEDNDILADSYAGHSVGEYAALVCAGVVSFEDGLLLIRKRGQLMQQVSERMADGGMLAVMGLTFSEAEEICHDCRKDNTEVYISTYNDIRQVVVSGRAEKLNKAKERFEACGAKTKLLEVKTAFHNPCMMEIVEPMREAIGRLRLASPQGKIYCNVTGKAYATMDEIYEYLPIQVSECVRFYDIINEMIADGTDIFIEAGRGKVLSNLLLKNRRGDYDVYPLGDMQKRSLFLNRISRGIDFGRLYLLGNICGELISEPRFIYEMGEELYYDINKILKQCMQDSVAPTIGQMVQCIDEYLKIIAADTNKELDKWQEYKQYFLSERAVNE